MKPSANLHIPVLLALALLGQSCNRADKSSAASDPAADDSLIHLSVEQFESNSMVLGQPVTRDFPEVLQVSGTIDVPPENRASVSAVSGGFVRDFSLLIGDRVRQGQRIVTLENPEFLELQQQYLETVEQLPFLESEFQRQKILLEEQISSEKLFLQAESQYRTALARSNGLRRQLELLHISPKSVEAGELSSLSPVLAPIDGSVTAVNVRKGSFVSPATEIVEIINSDHIHLELTVYEKDVQRVRIGQDIRFSLPELSDSLYDARVHLIGTALDENRTVKVHAHLKEEKEAHFLVGMFVRAQIEIEGAGQQQYLAVPETAVISIGGASYLLILEESSETGYAFRQVQVAVGPALQGYIALEPESGLSESSQVLLQGAFNLVGAK
ncbi:MAG TPA: efflux RND transporter periplasmic adaptor subunit [Robiginitalea sp.]|nr:efflux RND transporter periplasmic adaptor subunit [Robiginitalea sp.]